MAEEHDGCKGCKFIWKEANEEPCVSCKCNCTDNYKRQTNIDVLTTMTPLLLAKWLSEITNHERGTVQEWLDWLNEEIEVKDE